MKTFQTNQVEVERYYSLPPQHKYTFHYGYKYSLLLTLHFLIS